MSIADLPDAELGVISVNETSPPCGKKGRWVFRVAACHVERAYFSKGLCKGCYEKQYNVTMSDGAKEKQRATRLRWWHRHKAKYPRDPVKHRAVSLKRLYGLSQDEFDAILVTQDNKCAVCRAEHGNNRATRLQVDHDHSCCDRVGSCGKCVRGLLCIKCNLALGALRDDPRLIESLLDYLGSWSAKTHG